MNSQPSLEYHERKAKYFLESAKKYKVDDPVVAKICAFYAAYHAMRFAILTDPILDKSDDEINRLTNAPGLIRDSRYATHHSGHRYSGRGIGQNQVIQALYPSKAFAYERLHRASVDARYGSSPGEVIIDAADACVKAQEIIDVVFSPEGLRWVPRSNR